MRHPIFFGLITLSIVSCAIIEPTQPPSTIGLYGPKPVAQDIRGSSAQAIIDRQVTFSSEEVFAAAKQVFLREGYRLELPDPDNYTLSGSYIAYCGGISMAIYIKQIAPEPLTQFHIVMDGYDIYCRQDTVMGEASGLANKIEHILSVY